MKILSEPPMFVILFPCLQTDLFMFRRCTELPPFLLYFFGVQGLDVLKSEITGSLVTPVLSLKTILVYYVLLLEKGLYALSLPTDGFVLGGDKQLLGSEVTLKQCTLGLVRYV